MAWWRWLQYVITSCYTLRLFPSILLSSWINPAHYQRYWCLKISTCRSMSRGYSFDLLVNSCRSWPLVLRNYHSVSISTRFEQDFDLLVKFCDMHPKGTILSESETYIQPFISSPNISGSFRLEVCTYISCTYKAYVREVSPPSK